MADAPAPAPAAPGASRADDAAAMLLSLAADLPHPPRGRPAASSDDDDELRMLADWVARTTAGGADGPAPSDRATSTPPSQGPGPTPSRQSASPLPAAQRSDAQRSGAQQSDRQRPDGIRPRRPRLLGLCEPGESQALAAVLAAAGLDLGERQLSPDSADLPAAIARAVDAVDAEVDGGADLLLIVAGALDRPAALGLTSLLCRIEPAALMPYAAVGDDAGWMRELSLIRDARRDAARLPASVAHGLCATGGAALAAAAAALLQAARRRTPAIIDGLTPAVAAMAADALAPGAVGWWQLAGNLRSAVEPAITARLALRPLCPLGAGAPPGAAGALSVAMMRVAAAAR